MYESSAVITGIVMLATFAAFAIGGIILLINRVWEPGVSAVMVGIGIPVLGLVIGYTPLVTNLWQFGFAVLVWMFVGLMLIVYLPIIFPHQSHEPTT